MSEGGSGIIDGVLIKLGLKKPAVPVWQKPAMNQEQAESRERADDAIRKNLPVVVPPSEVNPSMGVDPIKPAPDQPDPQT